MIIITSYLILVLLSKLILLILFVVIKCIHLALNHQNKNKVYLFIMISILLAKRSKSYQCNQKITQKFLNVQINLQMKKFVKMMKILLKQIAFSSQKNLQIFQ
ncbi:transmembrane protein, putative (macronuclear) [Tetrahymena thermophila SB210]|uniref:Transmembrane protein, putative n=1 Tax=Tetrahymena thermophila (strain SB210) TaxID=312017 RepID=W7XCH4_TETTS|nr:transmembrane protein, putative [Tetrahymena thermophila SB210]EWS71466.1 transmembrane protein, putative [Tetrahymena thermophila SB210]|eukprot:XP_012656000.1 transmembrane protein, putative [Tetrahymena thermophila SB210]